MSNYSPSGPTREQLIELAEMYGTADHSLDWDSSGNLVGPGVQYWPTQLDYEGEVLRRKLFGQGQQGLVFVPQPKVLGEQELYKLDDFTGPVTANGDPVGGGQEVSGNDNHLTQSVSADRPTYGTDGSLHWLEGDGVGDHLIIPDSSFVFAESQYFSIAFSQVASEQSRYLFGGSSDTYFGLILNSGVLRPYVSTDSGTVAFNSQSIVSGTNYVATLIWDKPAQELILRLNGAEIGRSSAPGTGITNGASFSLLGRGGTTNTANARVYGAVKASYLPSAQQFQDVENYLANLAGITL